MEVLILVGGAGTRLTPVLGATPKALAPVAGRPFVIYLLDQVEREGFSRAVLLTGHSAEAIEEALGSVHGNHLELSYSREVTPLGTAGALRLAAERFPSSRYLVLNGDSLFDIGVGRLIEAHERTGACITLALGQADDPSRYGTVETDGAGRVTRFAEKQPLGGPALVNGGLYVIEGEVLTELAAGVEVSLEREVLPSYVGRGLHAVAFTGLPIDIGIPPAYADVAARPELLTARGATPC